jgi:glutaminase
MTPGQLVDAELLERVREAAGPDADDFGFAVAAVDGDVSGTGDWSRPFPIQSISKVFALTLVIAHSGQAIWRRVGREPSGHQFNSLVQVEYDQGVPRNPFINAGALVVIDELLSLTGDACGAVRELARDQGENQAIDVDPAVAADQAANGERNAALAHLLASFGNLRNEVDVVLDHYFRQCAIRMSCAEVALAAGYLARHGVRRDGSRLLSRSDAKRVNAVMLTSGTYDAAGEFAYRVGLPGKSGVGGGIVAVIPNRCTICAWSPRLDAAGNSIAAVNALDAFTTITGWSIF